jgi:hypothetical protein
VKVTTEEFPAGLRCCDCGNEILPGDYYEAAPVGMTEGGVPVEELVCLRCAP